MLTALEAAEAGWVVASGSLPRGVPEDFYATAARLCAARGQSFVLDSSGPPLKAALGCGLALIKPSLNELQSLVGCELNDPRVQDEQAMRLVREGAARMVAVSLGADGALLATPQGVVRRAALAGVVRSTVGAGDAFLAATTLALARGRTAEQAVAWGIAAASVAVSGVGTARLTRAAVEALVPDAAR
jgi:6-phosphofructokinase 2